MKFRVHEAANVEVGVTLQAEHLKLNGVDEGMKQSSLRQLLAEIETELCLGGKEVVRTTGRSTGGSQATGTRPLGIGTRNHHAPTLKSGPNRTRGGTAIWFHRSGEDNAPRHLSLVA